MAQTAEYIAISTYNSQHGWTVIARGSDKTAVSQDADAAITGTDIYAETLRKNLTVVSKTVARRMAGRCALGECDHQHDIDA